MNSHGHYHDNKLVSKLNSLIDDGNEHEKNAVCEQRKLLREIRNEGEVGAGICESVSSRYKIKMMKTMTTTLMMTINQVVVEA